MVVVIAEDKCCLGLFFTNFLFVENWILLTGMMCCLIKIEVTFKATLLLRVKITFSIICCSDSVYDSVLFFQDFLKLKHLRKQIL